MHFCAPGRTFETRTKLQKNTPKPQKLIRFLKNYSENTKKNFKNKCSFLSVSLPENHVSSNFLLPKNMCIFFQHSETEFGHFEYSVRLILSEYWKKLETQYFPNFRSVLSSTQILRKKIILAQLKLLTTLQKIKHLKNYMVFVLFCGHYDDYQHLFKTRPKPQEPPTPYLSVN